MNETYEYSFTGIDSSSILDQSLTDIIETASQRMEGDYYE